MTVTHPAMRGKFGSTEFFVVTMPASQLARSLMLPKEIEGWEDFSIEERFQRDVNFKRVKEHIAPYLANDPDRFFGAFIVSIYNSDAVEFEPFSKIVSKDSLPKHYAGSINQFGFLHLPGDDVLVPLDGQHRLTAIKFAISGKDEKQHDIPGLNSSMDLGKDICTCIMIRHEKEKARKIFNKVNRYAKSTSKSDNLITADDDIVATITREIVLNKKFDRIVNFKSNTLNKAATEFTTLSVLYEATGIVLESTLGVNHKIDRTVLPVGPEKEVMEKSARDFWKNFFGKIENFKAPLDDLKESGDEKRKQFREDYVLGKPIVQLALVEAITRLAEPAKDSSRPTIDDIYKRVNKCNWATDNPIWQRVLMDGENVITGGQKKKFAARFIAYLLGEHLDKVELRTLSEQYEELFDERGRKLPKPIA